MWISWKMILWKCEFCEKWDFEIVNFVKNEIFKLRILWKLWFPNCEFLDELRIFAPVWNSNLQIGGKDSSYVSPSALFLLPPTWSKEIKQVQVSSDSVSVSFNSTKYFGFVLLLHDPRISCLFQPMLSSISKEFIETWQTSNMLKHCNSWKSWRVMKSMTSN